MAKEVTGGDWERNYREKHLSFLRKRQRRRSLAESALHTDLVSLGAPFTDLQISLLFFEVRKDGYDWHRLQNSTQHSHKKLILSAA